MTRNKQNILHIFFILLVLILCFIIVPRNDAYEAKGIYLPKYQHNMVPISPSKINAINLSDKQGRLYYENLDKAIGLIRVSKMVDNYKDFNDICKQNVNKAIDLAAQNGIDRIKYICTYPQGELNQLSSVTLQAYAFKD